MAPPPIDGHRGRDLLEVEELVGGHDPAAVDLEPGQGPGHRAGGQDDVAADDHPTGILTVDDPHPAIGLEGARCRRGW